MNNLEVLQVSLERLCKSAKRIDKIDAITGPLSVALYHSGSEVLYGIGVAMSVAEITFLKLPWLASYMVQTKDVVAPLFITAKEVVSNSNKISGIIDVVPFYSMVMNYKTSGS
ncbi:hypothetical protein K9M74_01595 [Candidatus Woesearchaeota archaeon]|nr:hypothetical protein [Candidatus Woesearchaeota archaeon]